MRTIRIKFVDFFPAWNEENNFIIRALRKKYDVEFSDQPDYLICSCFGDESLKYRDCVKIFWTGEDLTPDFNLYDYGIAYDHLTFGDRYLRFPFFAIADNVKKAVEVHETAVEQAAQKTGFCSFVVSNGNANPIREEMFHLLSEYQPVASGGRFLNNVGGPVEDKIEFQSHYKFCIAFENDSSDGYTSEKILDAFRSGAIPIYWGNRYISNDFNPAAFINCHDFASLEQVVAYVKEVDNDPQLYQQILSEPMFIDHQIPHNFTSEGLEEFLYRIIDQPIEQAKRIAEFSFKRTYTTNQKEKADYFHLMHHNILYKIMHKVVK